MFSATSLPYARKLVLSLALVALPVAAQTGLGVVRGTVQDASKAVIPGARVTLTNTATGVARDSETNAAAFIAQVEPRDLHVAAQRVCAPQP